MALTAVLEFGDNHIKRYSKQYMVSDCQLVYARSYNEFCPEQSARCERMEVVVVAPGKDDLSFFQWFSRRETRDGRVVINLANDAQSMNSAPQIIYFEEAQCFSLSEVYDIDTSHRRLIRLALMPRTIDLTVENV